MKKQIKKTEEELLTDFINFIKKSSTFISVLSGQKADLKPLFDYLENQKTLYIQNVVGEI